MRWPTLVDPVKETFAKSTARARQNLKDARRQSSAVGDLSQLQRGQRRDGRRFQHRAIAGSERRRGFPACDRKREVPGDDAGDHAHWLAQGEVESAASDWNGLAAEFAYRPSVIFEHARAKRCLVPGIGDRFADLAHFELRHFLNLIA